MWVKRRNKSLSQKVDFTDINNWFRPIVVLYARAYLRLKDVDILYHHEYNAYINIFSKGDFLYEKQIE